MSTEWNNACSLVDSQYFLIEQINDTTIKLNILGKNSSVERMPAWKCWWTIKKKTGLWIALELMAQTEKNLPVMQETRFDPWVRKIPLRKEWLPTPVFLPGEFHGQRSLVDYSGGSKVLDMTDQLTLVG